MSRTLREYTITLALLAATLALTFYPMLFEGRTVLPSDMIDTMTLPFSQYYGPEHAYNSLITDGALQFYPLKYFTKEAYEHGNFAFWNPYILNGYPQYLEGMWTYNFVLFLPFAIGFPFILLLPLLVAGMGIYSLLREYAVRPGVARIFATAYMLNALFMTHLLAHFIPASFSFAPFVLLFLHKYWRSPQFKYLALSAMALALGFLAGNLQTIGFLGLLVLCYWLTLWTLAPRPSFIVLWRPMSLVFSFAIGLSAVMLLPMLELFQQTIAGGAFFSTSLLNSYSILQRLESIGLALTFFIPQLAGTIRGVTFDQAIGVYAQDFEGAIGFLPLLLAVWAGIVLWKRKPEVRPFVVLMIAGLALPIATPLFRFLYHRFLIVFILGACVTGALGLETILLTREWTASVRRWTKWAALGIACITCALGIFSLFRIYDFPAIDHFARLHLLPHLQHSVFAEGNAAWVQERFREALDYWRLTQPELLIGIGTSLAALAVLWWNEKLRTDGTLLLIWVLTAVQLVYFAYTWFPSNDTSRYPLYPNTPETRLLQTLGKHSRTYFYREIDTSKQFAFMNNENVVYDIPEATGYVSMMPRCLYIYTAIMHWREKGLVTPDFLGKFNIGTLARVKPLPFDSLPLLTAGPLWIYRNTRMSPRAFLAHTATVLANDSEILHNMADDSIPWPIAYFTKDSRARPLSTLSTMGDTVILSQTGKNILSFTASSHDSAYLILTDTYYPGWKATVDGIPTPVLRCNYAMRAVLLPPGSHTVEMRFAPTSFRIGVWISLATLFVLALICFRDVGWFGKIKERGTNDHITHLSANPQTIGK
ncbi:MAG TPA: YfhO family protein [Candidatus Kapabacteria bacterium]|nr:YfhO family protein [Candidatus Kapabacteria bacterium]